MIFRRKSSTAQIPHEIKISIRKQRNYERFWKTYYKRIAHIPTKLTSGKGTFQLCISDGEMYLMLSFTSGGEKRQRKAKKKKSPSWWIRGLIRGLEAYAKQQGLS